MTTMNCSAPPAASPFPLMRPQRMNVMQPITPELQIITKVSPRQGVCPIHDNMGAPLLCSGDVAVYDEDALCREGLLEGLYVIEYQSTVASLPRGDFAERFAAGDPTARLKIRRSVVQVRRWRKDPEKWITQPMGPQGLRRDGMIGFSDGPYDEFIVANKLCGPVVGIYRPLLAAHEAQ